MIFLKYVLLTKIKVFHRKHLLNLPETSGASGK